MRKVSFGIYYSWKGTGEGKMNKIIILLFSVFLTGAWVCSAGQAEAVTAVQSCTVIETQQSEHYTYLLVDRNGEQFWISTIASYLPKDIKSGDTVEYTGGLTITGFKSTSMDMTFDTMLLVSKIWVVRDAATK